LYQLSSALRRLFLLYKRYKTRDCYLAIGPPTVNGKYFNFLFVFFFLCLSVLCAIKNYYYSRWYSHQRDKTRCSPPIRYMVRLGAQYSYCAHGYKTYLNLPTHNMCNMCVFSLCVIHKEGLCPSSRGINRLMMMMMTHNRFMRNVTYNRSISETVPKSCIHAYSAFSKCRAEVNNQ
jgi:hypothetical protein